MKRLGFHSLQTSIFFVISSMVTVVLFCAVGLYLFTTSHTLRTNYITTSNQMAKIVSSQMDSILREIDTLQIRILESEIVREYVFGDYTVEELKRQQAVLERLFEKEVYSIAGYDYPFYHLSIISHGENLFQFGRLFSYETISDMPLEWKTKIDTIQANNGYKYISNLQQPKFYGDGNFSVSVCRSFSRYPLNQPQAVIEIQVSETKIAKKVQSNLLSYTNLASGVVIFDEHNQLIFPASLPPEQLEHYITTNEGGKTKNPYTGQQEMVSRYSSSYSGWTTAVVTPYSAITSNMQQYIQYAVWIGLLAFLANTVIAFAVSKSVSSPIINIKESLLKVGLDSLPPSGVNIKTRYSELELLQQSVEEMRHKLDDSLEEYVHLRSLSIQSRLLALQSQMNPHFIYNTLSIMAILAEEKGDLEVSHMCRQLVSMLRYISSDIENVTLQQEIAHTRQYADLIQIRFGKSVEISYDIDPDLLQVEMPPILVQPLVENSVKYGRSSKTTLKITIKAYTTNKHWYIQVADNGAGFADFALQNLKDKIKNKADWEQLVQHEIQGVGLANIYMRLQLFYEGDFEFTVTNNSEGASVTIGGPISQELKKG